MGNMLPEIPIVSGLLERIPSMVSEILLTLAPDQNLHSRYRVILNTRKF